MIVTEKEAESKWCPHVRQAAEDVYGTFNRGQPDDPTNDHANNSGTLCNCIGSRCMQWRWHERDRRHPGRSFRGHRPPDSDPRWRADSVATLDDESVAGIEAWEKQQPEPGPWVWDWHIPGEPKPDTGFCGLAYSVRLP